jgi:hypothetical protein
LPVAGINCITPICTASALLLRIERRLLIALRGKHQRIEVVLTAVFVEEAEHRAEAFLVLRGGCAVTRLDRLHVLTLPVRDRGHLLCFVRVGIADRRG